MNDTTSHSYGYQHTHALNAGEDEPLLPKTSSLQNRPPLDASTLHAQSIPYSSMNNNNGKRRVSTYDVSSTMTRLRDSMVGTSPTGSSNLHLHNNSSNNTGLSNNSYHQCDYNIRDELLSSTNVSALHHKPPKTRNVSPLPTSKNKYNRQNVESFDQSVRLGISSSHEDFINTFQPKSSSPLPKSNGHNKGRNMEENHKNDKVKKTLSQQIINAFHQIPAVTLIAIFHLMIGIPFGVSYFPIGWKEEDNNLSSTIGGDKDYNDQYINGPFPVQGKNALGIRMFLFSTIIGQIVLTMKSGFHNPIGLQMVENVPFCQALAAITIKHCGYGIEALSTLFVMFGLSSMLVGVVFYILGKYQLGRIIYFFPSHVLVGLIAGIGIFIMKTGIEVTINTVFSLQALGSHYKLLEVVFIFELLLRILEKLNVMYGKNGKPLFSLLSPIYFCLITPTFYFVIWVVGISVNDARRDGYFFPSLVDDCEGDDSCSTGTSSISAFVSFFNSTVFDKDIFVMWRVVDFTNVSWISIWNSIPTLISVTIFSLIHVPINIPAFAVSTTCEYDMNKELIAHGYSNCISGCFGGLQNYMAYTQSILYDRSGGYGKTSGLAVGFVTTILFFVGPRIASLLPRCMAGTLLVHVGIDLFLEGVFDTLGKFESIEYAGIWLIAVVMTFFGMDAAMIAGKTRRL